MSDEFEDYPKSIQEIQAERSQSGTKWTPRDALISLLREIDGGLNVDCLVMCYRILDKELPEGQQVAMKQATPDLVAAMGVWLLAKESMLIRAKIR